MHAATTALGLLSLLLPPVVSGFRVTGKETPDGFYKAYYDASGKEVHELLTPATVEADKQHIKAAGLVSIAPGISARDARGLLNARDDQRLYCGCGLILDRSDCDAAVANMKNQINNNGGTVYVPIGQAYYAVRGGVVSFICSRKGNSAVTGVSVAGFTDLLKEVTKYCGQYVPGTYKHGTPIDTAAVDVGYMFSGQDFCARAESSSKDRC
ncbi:hypothetical protein QBC44DRAFT_254185 [Cladorrhinum sp. PSN332]|nr:hypothetical protein QBC44DRAFT_254185 [Cladorrhinum sp. PSN332]